MYALSALTTFVSITFVGGFPFLLAVIIICAFYFNGEPPGEVGSRRY